MTALRCLRKGCHSVPDSAWARGEKGGNRTRNTTWNTVKRFFLLSYLPMLPAQARNLLAALLTLHSLGLGFAAFYLQRHSCGFRDTGAGPWVRTTARRKRYRAHLRRWATVPRILPVFSRQSEAPPSCKIISAATDMTPPSKKSGSFLNHASTSGPRIVGWFLRTIA